MLALFPALPAAPPGTSGSYARLIHDIRQLPGGATLAAEMARVVGGDRTGLANPEWAASVAVLMTDVESMRGKATMATAAMVMPNAMTTGDLAHALTGFPMIPKGAQAAADEVNTYLSSGGLGGKTEASLSSGAQAMIKAEVDLVEAWIKLQDIKVDAGSKKSVEDQLCDQIRKRIHVFYGTAPEDVKMFQMWQDAKRQGYDFQTFTRIYRAGKG